MKTIKRILLVGGLGYIGSFLLNKLNQEGIVVDVCDSLVRTPPNNYEDLVLNQLYTDDYSSLPTEILFQYSAVLWFAGHSSVGSSISDPQGALQNNCLNLFKFAQKLKPTTKLIYASTGSLYSAAKIIKPASENDLINIPTQNSYDISKFAFDYLAENFLNNYFGLRMGTVSGFSQNLRPELVFNSMNISANTTGKVLLKNKDSYRTILFLEDLWLLIHELLSNNHAPGFYNAGSASFKLGELGKIIASVWGAELIDQGESPTYSFLLNTEKMNRICNLKHNHADIDANCRLFWDKAREWNRR